MYICVFLHPKVEKCLCPSDHNFGKKCLGKTCPMLEPKEKQVYPEAFGADLEYFLGVRESLGAKRDIYYNPHVNPPYIIVRCGPTPHDFLAFKLCVCRDAYEYGSTKLRAEVYALAMRLPFPNPNPTNGKQPEPLDTTL